MEILFERGVHFLEGILHDKEESLASSVDVIGKPLIVYNIEKISSAHGKIQRVFLPEGLSRTASLIETSFPSIQIDEYRDVNEIPVEDNLLKIPLNSYMTQKADNTYMVNQMVYPWDILLFAERVLQSEVKETRISENASVSERAVVARPCVIAENALLDDFCKVKGPAYIGPRSRVGMGSLVRDSMIGEGSAVGFNVEVGRSYLAGSDRLAHHDVVLDSVLGWNVWMAAFVGITNVLLNTKNIRYKIGEELIDTGLQKLGAVIGHDCSLGAGVITLPGRYIPPNSLLQAGTVFSAAPTELRFEGTAA